MPARSRTLLLTLALLVPVAAGTAHAAEGDGSGEPRLRLKPARYAAEIAPGQRADVTLTLVNDLSDTVRVSFSTIDLVAPQETDSFAAAATRRPARSAVDWVRIGSDAITIDPGDTARVPVQVVVPDSARPGAHAFAITASQTFSSVAIDDAQAVGAKIRARVNLGSTFVIAVPGDAESSARIVSVQSPRLVWASDDDVQFRARVRNSGDTLLELEAATRLSSFGTFARRELRTPDELPTLPDGERILRMEWTDRPWIGWYRPELVVVGGAGSNVRLERELPTVFVLPPWWVLALLVLAIALPVSSERRRRRRIREHHAARARRRAGLDED